MKNRFIRLALNSLSLSVFFFQSFASAGAITCNPFNLYETKDSPLASLPIEDQGPFGICYAHAASELATYYTESHPKNPGDEQRVVSPPWAAFNYKYHHDFLSRTLLDTKKTMDYGFSKITYEDLNEYGSCDPKLISQRIHSFLNLAPSELSLTESELLENFELFWDIFKNTPSPSFDEAFSAYQSAVSRRYLDPSIAHLYRDPEKLARFALPLVPALRSEYEHQMAQGYKTFFEFLKNEIFGDCHDGAVAPMNLPKIHTMGEFYISDSNLYKKINSVWDQQKTPQPLILGACDRFYFDPEAPALHLKSSLLPRVLRTTGDDCDMHYTLLVGRRPTPENGCEVLMRNSHGTGFWAGKRTCLCEKQDAPGYEDCQIDHPQDKDKKVVACWFDLNEITPKTFDIEYYLEK